MKTIQTTFVLTMLMVVMLTPTLANDGKYIDAMQKNIVALNGAKTIADLQNTVNTFERIATKEKNKWEPYYYLGFGYILMATREQDGAKKDAYLDQAQVAVNKTREIVPEESELVALEGFLNMIRLTVDPATRGQKYAPQAMQLFSKAVELNPENPRALILLAQMQLGTARFFGSPTDEACATADKGIEKLRNFKSENPLAPQWGKSMAETLKKECGN